MNKKHNPSDEHLIGDQWFEPKDDSLKELDKVISSRRKFLTIGSGAAGAGKVASLTPKGLDRIFINEAEHIDLKCPLPPMNISCDFAAPGKSDFKSILIVGGQSGGKSKEIKRMIAEHQAKGFNVHVITQQQFDELEKKNIRPEGLEQHIINSELFSFNFDANWHDNIEVLDIVPKINKVHAAEVKQMIQRKSRSIIKGLQEVPKKYSGPRNTPKKKKRK